MRMIYSVADLAQNQHASHTLQTSYDLMLAVVCEGEGAGLVKWRCLSYYAINTGKFSVFER
jgi:hypothetical protein